MRPAIQNKTIPKGYKQTEIGVIPEDWESVFIKEIAKITTGNKDTQNKIVDGKYPFFVRSQDVERINSYSFDGEAVLTSGDGVGVGKIFHYIIGKFDYHQRVYNIHDFKQYDGKFFYYYFSNYFYDRVMQMTAKSSVDSVRREMISNMSIPLPPTQQEQQAIAEVLSDTDKSIESIQNLIAKKKAIKQGTMQELLTGKKRLAGFSGKWETKQIKDIGGVKMCKRIFSYQTDDSGDIPFYKIRTFGKIADSFIEKSLFINYKNKYSYPKNGEILISASGTIGRTVIYNGENAYYQDSNIVWIENDESLVTNKFLYNIYKSINFNTEGSTIKRLYNKLLLNITFLCPSINEQKAIAQVLNDMDLEIESLNAQLQKTKALKQGLMQELLTGKTRLV